MFFFYNWFFVRLLRTKVMHLAERKNVSTRVVDCGREFIVCVYVCLQGDDSLISGTSLRRGFLPQEHPGNSTINTFKFLIKLTDRL